ncbi:hypothetical protein [Spirillospora sp. CA-294931]|uniref:hypothetical protein n=1 Tax=Spirillospora sp. CA-294931 TaxID=3240042 RepID=UPI003D8EB634
MPQQQAFPDLEPIIVAHQLELVPTVWSCLELPPTTEFNSRLPVAQYSRVPAGGAARGTWAHGFLLDKATIDVDVYAGSRETANAAARLLRTSLLGLAGTVRDGAGFVSAAETTGPGWRPEASQDITRIGWLVSLTVRPMP